MYKIEELLKYLSLELSDIKEALKDVDLRGDVKKSLLERQDQIQALLNKVLSKKGVLTETEKDKVYEQVRLIKKNELQADSMRGYTGFYIAGAVLLIGLYFAFKNKK